MKRKKIERVVIVFVGGERRESAPDVALDYLQRYADDLAIERLGPINGPLFRAYRDAREMWATASRKLNAAKPRKAKAVTRGALVAHRDQWERDHGSRRGWVKAACLEFGIADSRTLRQRMKQ